MSDAYRNCNEEEVFLMVDLFSGYLGLILNHRDELESFPLECRADNLLSLCNEVINHAADHPFDKLNRWLGFVQGVLATAKVIDVQEERNYTRPKFHALYRRTAKSFGDK